MAKTKVKSQEQNKSVDRDRINEVAENLEGTCRDLSDFATEAEQESQDFLEELDSLVLLCNGCGWWSEVSEFAEVNGEEFCGDCRGV